MTVTDGDWGIVLPASSGKYKYIFHKVSQPAAGDKVLVYPAHSRKYYLLRLAVNAIPGEKIIVISDRKGNHWGVSVD